jgi:hypothetical protein
MTRAFFDCPKCNGSGQVSFKHVANGRCFLCQGSGKLASTKEALAKAAALGIAPRNDLPEAERCTLKQLHEITRLAVSKRTSESRLAVEAGVPEVNGMDNWRYELSRKQASRIIEHGRAA